MIINEKELRLDIIDMITTYDADITMDEAKEIMEDIYFEVEDIMYQASSNYVIDYINNLNSKKD